MRDITIKNMWRARAPRDQSCWQIYKIKQKISRYSKKKKKFIRKPSTVGRYPQSQIDRRLEGGARPRQSTK